MYAGIKIKKLNDQLLHQKQNLDYAESSLHQTEDKLALTKDVIKTKDQKIADLKEEVENYKNKVDKLETEKDNQTSVLKQALMQIKKLQNMNEKNKARIEELEQALFEKAFQIDPVEDDDQTFKKSSMKDGIFKGKPIEISKKEKDQQPYSVSNSNSVSFLGTPVPNKAITSRRKKSRGDFDDIPIRKDT